MKLGLAPDAGPFWLRAIRWSARAASLASLGMLAIFLTSGGGAPTSFELLLFACFPVGVAIGMSLAWFREIAGGLVALSSLVAFHLLFLLAGDRPPSGPWFAIFASPGLVLLGVGIAAKRSRRASETVLPSR